MAKIGKRLKEINTLVDSGKFYSVDDALSLLKENSKVKFEESIDTAIILGVDPRKSDQVVRGATVLPHGTGKIVKVGVFTQGANVDIAKESGADAVGLEDLAETIKSGQIPFNVIIASPDAMRIVGQLGTILGPRGLMPNPKVGTVTSDIADAIIKAKSGQVRYRTDKAGIIHCSIGKVSFDVDSLKANLKVLIEDLMKLKPSSSKGIYLKKLALSTTMGPGLAIDQSSL
ncbi:50S ribosomal protein L1 [Candidatus Nitrosacidococcus tergens]|uniref:Large ribosomal subunit protein uL1 n=1 Tax=Candidatus Nitrosacidococcus tergens TaxID=553981 RepID=A0A7G1Q7V8_9GAMM|nr:50S ribosomal protein L1 [Candidatus Nitrosacidococcus tergens]CAB1274786.1 50S ribosomal subunit protein L1 [Candidatus Nitrosacidococcus tergens]